MLVDCGLRFGFWCSGGRKGFDGWRDEGYKRFYLV